MDERKAGDAHIRLVRETIQRTFPLLSGLTPKATLRDRLRGIRASRALLSQLGLSHLPPAARKSVAERLSFALSSQRRLPSTRRGFL